MTTPPASAPLLLERAAGLRIPPRSLAVVFGLAAQIGLAQAPTPQRLEPDKPVPRELKDGDSHTYEIALGGDEYLEVVIEQQGVDVAATFTGAEGTTYASLNAAKGVIGSERLTFISRAAGPYHLTIRPAEGRAPAGRYQVQLVARRPPTAAERTLEDARVMLERARVLRQDGKYDAALPLARQAVVVREGALPPGDLAIADALHLVAVILDDRRDYAEAEAPNRRALAIREAALGPDHPDVARSLFNLAWLAKVKLDFSAAEALYKRALAIQERALGEEHSEVATTLNDMAVLYNQRGDTEQSIAINRRVLAIREKVLGPNDDGVAKALNNLARAHERNGEPQLAIPLAERAVAVWESSLGPDHPELAFALDTLAGLNATLGDFPRSESLYRRALAIREKSLGPDHPEVGTTLNNLAVLYRQRGDYATAEPLLLRDLAITEKALGPAHSFVAPTLSNLGILYGLQGQPAKAEAAFLRALNIQEKVFGPNHLAVGVTLSRIGQLYLQTGDARAEASLTRALATLEQVGGPEHPEVAVALAALARVATNRNDRSTAVTYNRRALGIQEKTFGLTHAVVADSLERLASLAVEDGNAGEAVSLLSRAHDIREQDLAHNLPLGSERQKIGYLDLFAADTDRAVSLHVRAAPADGRALNLALNTILRRKGRALDATADNVAALRRGASPDTTILLDQLSTARTQLATVTLRGPGGLSARVYRAQLERLQKAVDALETEVATRSAGFQAQSQQITVDGVQRRVPADAVLIEFVRYRPDAAGRTPSPIPRYAAYTLASAGPPRWIDLGDAAGIDAAIGQWRQALRDPARTDATRLARRLDALVMQPVRGMLGDQQHLLISPDGVLNLIPFAALVDERNTYLVERYTITYLTSGRDLLRLQVPRPSRTEALIVASPSFGAPSSIAPRQVFFGPLPGAHDEVRGLRQLLPQASVLLNDEATEAALKRVAGPRILHVATHGFFLSEERDQPPAVAADRRRVGRWSAWTDNPLLRSGLALAGANVGKSGEEDGVLTALEAAGLDLWGTKLVVLSACDTGVGEVKQGDGVYGLRRALVLAGAESQLMSLWPVSDRSTRDLMIGYYTALTEGQGRGAALRDAQLKTLGQPSRRHPYYWASFIQSGEWASLDGARR